MGHRRFRRSAKAEELFIFLPCFQIIGISGTRLGAVRNWIDLPTTRRAQRPHSPALTLPFFHWARRITSQSQAHTAGAC